MSRKQTSDTRHAEENASACREYLHNYDLSLIHLTAWLNALVDPAKTPNVETAKAELAFAMARFKFVAGETIWRGTSVDFEQELQKISELASKHGIDSDDEQRILRGMFSTVTYWAGYIAGTLSDNPEYKNI